MTAIKTDGLLDKVSFSGSSSARQMFILLDNYSIPAGRYFFAPTPVEGVDGSTFVWQVLDKSTTVWDTITGNGLIKTISVDSTIAMRLVIFAGYSISMDIYPMVIKLDEYEPYSDGSFNAVNFNNIGSGSSGGISRTAMYYGGQLQQVRIAGQSSNRHESILLDGYPISAGTYYFAPTPVAGIDGSTFVWQVLDRATTTWDTIPAEGLIKKFTNDTTIAMRLVVFANYAINMGIKPMVIRLDAYVPYQYSKYAPISAVVSPSLSMGDSTVDISGVTLAGIMDSSDAATVCIGGKASASDYIDASMGVIYRLTTTVQFTGAEEWGYDSTAKMFSAPVSGIYDADGAMCSHYARGQSVFFGHGVVSISDGRFTSVSEYKAYLTEQMAAGTPVTIVARLYSMSVSELTDRQRSALSALTTTEGSTGVSWTAGSGNVFPVISYTQRTDVLRYPGERNLLTRIVRLMNNAVKYILNTALPGMYPDGFSIAANTEAAVRHPMAACNAVAILIHSGYYDEDIIGITIEAATSTVVSMIKVAAQRHVSQGGVWGHAWQSGLWATYMGEAAYLLYDGFTPAEKRVLHNVIMSEARYAYNTTSNDNNIYWKDASGTVLHQGDTKSEEVLWWNGIIQLSLLMYPASGKADIFRNRSAKLGVVAYSMESDLSKNRITNGFAWPSLGGYNVQSNGTVVNHNIVHPEYMTSGAFSLLGVMSLYRYLGVPVMAALDHNLTKIGQSLYTADFSGRTIYEAGEREIYYPEGNDWGTNRMYDLAVFDCMIYQWGEDPASDWSRWAELHLDKLVQMQNRSSTGQMYVNADEDTYGGIYGREMAVGCVIGHALLCLLGSTLEKDYVTA